MEPLNPSKQWFALIAKPQQDKKLARFLDRHQLEYYLPLCKSQRQWSDRIKTIEVPIMSPYLFVRASGQEQNLVFHSHATLGYVKIGGRPASISDRDIQLIQLWCSTGYEPELTQESLVCGDRVQIVAGPLKGMCGCIVKCHGRHRFGLRLETMGLWMVCEIEKKILRRMVS